METYKNEMKSISDNRELYHQYRDEVHKKYPNACIERFEFAEKIMPGKMYMYYAINELQDATMITQYPDTKIVMNNITFSSEDIEMFLRAMAFMFDYSDDSLPESNFDYMKEKSRGFINHLFSKVKENIDL